MPEFSVYLLAPDMLRKITGLMAEAVVGKKNKNKNAKKDNGGGRAATNDSKNLKDEQLIVAKL